MRLRAYLLLVAMNAALPFCLIAAAELRLNAALAAILNATTPLFTAGVAWVWTCDRMTLKKLLGILLGMVGVAVLVGWNLHRPLAACWGQSPCRWPLPCFMA